MDTTNRLDPALNGKGTAKPTTEQKKPVGTKPRSHFHATVEALTRHDIFALKVFKKVCVPDMVAYLSQPFAVGDREKFAIDFFAGLAHADPKVRDVAAFALGELVEAVPLRTEFLGGMLMALTELPAYNDEHDTAVMLAGVKLSAALRDSSRAA